MVRDHPRQMDDIVVRVDGENYLAKTVYEPDEYIDIGLLDEFGNKLVVRRRRNPIGFVHFT